MSEASPRVAPARRKWLAGFHLGDLCVGQPSMLAALIFAQPDQTRN